MSLLLLGAGPPPAGRPLPSLLTATLSNLTISTSLLTVVFNGAVVWTGAQDASLTGTQSSALTYLSGSGTNTLTFAVTQQILTASSETFDLPAGGVTGAGGENPDLTLACTNNCGGPKYRHHVSALGTGGSSVVTLPTRSAGDYLVAGMMFIGTDITVPNTGWTLRSGIGVGLGTQRIRVFDRISDGTDNSFLATAPAADFAYIIFSVRDILSGAGSSFSTASSGPNSTVITISQATPVNTQSALWSFYVRREGTGAIASSPLQAPIPATQTVQSAVFLGGLEKLFSAGATGTRSATMSPAAANGGGGTIGLIN